MPRTLPRSPLATAVRYLSRLSPPPDAPAEPFIQVRNNVARIATRKEEPKPRQILSLPPFSAPGTDPLPGRKRDRRHVTAITWVKHYFADIPSDVVQSHFNKGLVHVESSDLDAPSGSSKSQMPFLKKIKHNDVMEAGMKIYLPVSVAETKIIKRYDTIPTATLHPNADEIEYLQRLVIYKDSAIIMLNKPPKVPVKGNLPVHNSMDALAAAALSYGNEEGPKLVHRLDRESSGLLLMGRKKESIARLHWLFSDKKLAKSSSQIWNNACEETVQRYWALVIGSPKYRHGFIRAPLSKVLLNDGKMERVILDPSGIDGCQEAVTEYRVLGPTINGCSWIELCPLTGRKHQLRVHCAEALGTPIVGDYKYGWFVHQKWKQMPRVDYDPSTRTPYKLRRPEGLEVQKGSVLSKVPLLHLHCREMVIPNIAKFLGNSGEWHDEGNAWSSQKPDLLRFVAPMPLHMKISWNLMSSYLMEHSQGHTTHRSISQACAGSTSDSVSRQEIETLVKIVQEQQEQIQELRQQVIHLTEQIYGKAEPLDFTASVANTPAQMVACSRCCQDGYNNVGCPHTTHDRLASNSAGEESGTYSLPFYPSEGWRISDYPEQ